MAIAAAMSTLTGCQEYNRYQPVAEAESLEHITQLTSGFERAGEAVFSRDQRFIAFLGLPANQIAPASHRLYVTKTQWNGNELTGVERPVCVTPASSRNLAACFSPDGTSLIFASTGSSANNSTTDKFPIDMRIFRFDSWEGAISMTDAATGIDLAQHALTVDRAYTGECAYSPDGRFICFTSMRDGNPDLYVMHADGSHIVQLTRTIGYDGGATFSPDGKHLLYHSDRYTNRLTQIFLADLAFDARGEITGITAEHQLTQDDFSSTSPAWHPDGVHIIYTTARHGRDNYELYLMTTTGRRKTRITYSPGADIFPAFSPDGRYLLWSSKRPGDGTIQLYAARFKFPTGS